MLFQNVCIAGKVCLRFMALCLLQTKSVFELFQEVTSFILDINRKSLKQVQ